MKKITKSYNVYKFNELSEKIQEELLEKETSNCQNFFCEFFLKDEMEEKAKELLNIFFGKNAKFNRVLYDLSYCQGSGAMIEFKLKYYNSNISIKNYGLYSHEYSFIIDYDDYNYLNEKRENYLKEKIIKMNKDLAKYGYDLIDFDNFKDEAIVSLEDSLFLEDGTLFTE